MGPETALRSVAGLLAVSAVLVAVEYCVLLRSGQMDSGGLFDWEILRLRRTFIGNRVMQPLDALFMTRTGTVAWLIIGPAAALTTALFLGTTVGLAAALVAAAAAVSQALRFPVGRDGADQLALFLALAVMTYQIVPSAASASLVLYVICAQMTAIYFVSGISKLFSRAWLRGDALWSILRTSCYGNPRLADHLDPRVAYVMGLTVVAFEVLFPIVWVANTEVSVALLTVGLVFHTVTWLTMGLNSFLTIFAAGYPALFWLVVR